MDETLSNELCEAAMAIGDAWDVLEDLRKRALPPNAQSHLSVARSSLGQAIRQLEIVVRAIEPEKAMQTPAQPARRD